MSDRTRWRHTRTGKIALSCVVALATVALLEGICSFGIFFYEVLEEAERPVAERRHTRHDPELGWVNVPGARVEDLYGPGRSVTINAQGFRGERDVGPEPAGGRVRMVCSGDSYVFGYGVDDGDVLGVQLERLEPRLEVVNMGQGGYGFDQAYLWYLREGRALDPDIHVFAIITNDLERMTADAFLGFGKPVLRLRDGVPVPDRVPVPQASFVAPWATQNAEILRKLGMVDVAARLTGTLGLARDHAVMQVAEALQVARAAVRHLVAIHREAGCAFAFVFLPASYELSAAVTDGMRRSFGSALREDGVAVVDLVEHVRQLPRDRQLALFLARGEVDFPGAAGHFSASGNRYFARQLLLELRSIPEVAARLPR